LGGRFFLTIPNTSSTIVWPASLRAERPFGFPRTPFGIDKNAVRHRKNPQSIERKIFEDFTGEGTFAGKYAVTPISRILQGQYTDSTGALRPDLADTTSLLGPTIGEIYEIKSEFSFPLGVLQKIAP
jgi:hypothetical protein